MYLYRRSNAKMRSQEIWAFFTLEPFFSRVWIPSGTQSSRPGERSQNYMISTYLLRSPKVHTKNGFTVISNPGEKSHVIQTLKYKFFSCECLLSSLKYKWEETFQEFKSYESKKSMFFKDISVTQKNFFISYIYFSLYCQN